MGLFGRLFGKQKAKIGLAMHIRSAKYYAKQSKKRSKAVRSAYDKQQKLNLELETAIREKPRSIKKITETAKNFIQACADEAKELDEISENVFTLEYKMIKELRKLIKDMEDVQGTLKNTPKLFTADASNDISELNEVFTKIKGTIRKEKKQMRDLKRNKEKLRDRSIMTDEMLLRSLRRFSRKEKKKVRKTEKIMDELHRLINHLKKMPSQHFEIIDRYRKQAISLNNEFKQHTITEGDFRAQSSQVKEALKNELSLLGLKNGEIDKIWKESDIFARSGKDEGYDYVSLNKRLNADLPKIKSDITELKGDIEDELTFLGKVMKAVVVLMERMKDLNQEKIDKEILSRSSFTSLRNKGLTNNSIGMIEAKQQEFLNTIKQSEIKELNRAKSLATTT